MTTSNRALGWLSSTLQPKFGQTILLTSGKSVNLGFRGGGQTGTRFAQRRMGNNPLACQRVFPDCEAHAEDLSRLYASYGTPVDPLVFKSDIYWAEWADFGLQFPALVAAWQANGGSEDDASFLDHPVCAEPLQTGWDGSDYFYDGAEHPLCRLYKIDPVAAAQ
mgnify:CR=1 FL=1